MTDCSAPRRWLGFVAILAALIPGLALGENWSRPSVRLRAVSAEVSADLVRFIATNTETARLDPANFELDRTKTPEEIIARRCGSVRPEYYEEFRKVNASQIAADVPIGEGARTLEWPSCLYIRPSETGIPTVVGKNDSADKVYTRLTGGHATLKELESFFGNTIPRLKRLQPGDILEGSHVTAAVQVVPKSGIDVDVFQAVFAALVKADPKTEARIPGVLIGEIVLPMEGNAQGGLASETSDCVPSGVPFDAGDVQVALSFSRKRQRELDIFPGQPNVIIVDSGFRGVELNNGESDPFNGTPFSKKYFLSKDESVIAQKIVIGRPYWPITSGDLNKPLAQGHGTHVAGLALGGPGFAEVRRASSYTDVWAKLTMINVSDGERTLADGAVEVLRGLLGVSEDDRIVNMSISFDGNVSDDIATAFDGMIKNGTKTLFIVAAGNRSRSVSGDIYPAALGALQEQNVITVAAVGGDSRLTSFSNFGPKTVDIAAPGCQIHSWLDSSMTETPLSGTSQATPIVTFAASLVHSLRPRTTPAMIKARLVTSGDLMHPDDYGKTAYRVILNIPKALYVFDDYLAMRGLHGEVYLGRATRLTGVRCVADPLNATRAVDAVWSLKRSGNVIWIFAGRNTGAAGKVEEPCVAGDPSTGTLRFVPEYRFNGTDFEAVLLEEVLEFPLTDISELVMRSRVPD